MYLEQVFGVIKIGVFVLLLVSITFSITYVFGKKMNIRWVSNLPTKKICLYSILMTYFLMLSYVVFWRGTDSGGEYTYNFKVFDSLRYAWYTGNRMEWRNIILNIILFVPFGLFIPVCFQKFRKLLHITILCIITTCIIEWTQCLLKIGVFQVDDIINNTLGGIIGFGFFLCLYSIFYQKSKRKTICISLTPFALTVLFFVSTWIVYETQPYGNLGLSYYDYIKVKKIKVDNEVYLDSTNRKGNILDIGIKSTVNDIEVLRYSLEMFDSSKTISSDNREISYVSPDNSKTLVYSTKDGWFYYSCEDGREVNRNDVYDIDNEGKIRSILKDLNIDVPDFAVYQSPEKGVYIFTIDEPECFEYLLGGRVVCELYKDGTLKYLTYEMYEYDTLEEVDIKSTSEVVKTLYEGKFYFGKREPVHNLEIKYISLSYAVDTKGYLHPIYIIFVIMDDVPGELKIPAAK